MIWGTVNIVCWWLFNWACEMMLNSWLNHCHLTDALLSHCNCWEKVRDCDCLVHICDRRVKCVKNVWSAESVELKIFLCIKISVFCFCADTKSLSVFYVSECVMTVTVMSLLLILFFFCNCDVTAQFSFTFLRLINIILLFFISLYSSCITLS